MENIEDFFVNIEVEISTKNDESTKTNTPKNSKPYDPNKLIYSQKIGKWIPTGSCLNCGSEDHLIRSPLCTFQPKLKKDSTEKKGTWHQSGQTTPQQRATRFSAWLDSTFDLRNVPGNIIDVAGGQGKLSLTLTFKYDQKCTIIDPREMVLSEHQRRLLEGEKSSRGLPNQKMALFEDNFLDDPENQELLESAKLIIGLHPDEATERIVQFGLNHQKNFAVLPCCVFPNKFSERKTKEGRHVKYYEEFCEYLLDLDPRIKKDTLDIPGVAKLWPNLAESK